jgi:2-polyprenyl-6-methoxyphenol hydroxylase-like FAD-dependent oxidoreductase
MYQKTVASAKPMTKNPMAEQVLDADLIVVGAGPSGLTVACEAALGGARVLVLEKRGGPTWSRAGTIAPRVMEIMASRGLDERLMGRALELHTEPRSRRGIWAGLGPLEYEAIDSDYKWILMFPQLETEKMLADHFRSLGGDLRLNCEAFDATQNEEGVVVHYRDAARSEHTVRGRYLVGADGNRSTIRKAAAIEWRGTPAQRIAVNVDAIVENPYPTPLTVKHNERGWAMTYPLRAGVTRFAFIDAASTSSSLDRTLDLDDAKLMLERVHGSSYGITQVEAINRFHDALYLADPICVDRIFLVGESVRVHYPASGVGMNFCIQDAFNLGWKLAAAIAGRAPHWLLKSYAEERLPEIRKLLASVRQQCAIQFNFDPEHVALKEFLEQELLPIPAVNLKISEELAGLSVRYPTLAGAPEIVGRRLANLKLRGGGCIFEALRPGKFLHVDFLGSGRCVRDDLHILSVSAEPTERSELKGLSGLLLRPDGHVAGAWQVSVGTGHLEDSIRTWLNLGADTAIWADTE